MADDERRGADDQLRDRLGLVLLDLGDGERGAVELEARDGGGYLAAEGVGSEFQLHGDGAEFCRLAGELLARGAAGCFCGGDGGRIYGMYVCSWDVTFRTG